MHALEEQPVLLVCPAAMEAAFLAFLLRGGRLALLGTDSVLLEVIRRLNLASLLTNEASSSLLFRCCLARICPLQKFRVLSGKRCTCLRLVAEVADDIGDMATFGSVLDLWQLDLLRALAGLGF